MLEGGETSINKIRYEWKEYIKQMIIEMLAPKEKSSVFQEMESTRTTGQTLRGLFNRKRIGNESAEYNTTIYTKEYGSDTAVKNKKRRVKTQKVEENFSRDQGTTPNEMVGKNELKEGRKEILALRNDSKENVEEEILTKWRLKVPGLPK
ncbi:Protein of unknown function [Gryllus bimaculatus]|nr:Protein of unknown function [Gryllus bimaculatus]